VVGEEDGVPVVFGEDGGVRVVDGFELGQRPGSKARGAKVGMAKQASIEVEDHVEFVATIVDE